MYDKRDDFNFDIVNFPHLDSNIPLGPAYGVYISQLVRYSRACCNYEDFRVRHLILVEKLLKQGYKQTRLKKSYLKFHAKYNDVVNRYNIDSRVILSDVNLYWIKLKSGSLYN